MASLTVALTAFAVIALAELPDKTALASLVLGTRYRPLPLLCGIAAAFAVHVVIAVAAGSLLGLLPRRLTEIVVAALFLAGAAVLLLARRPAGQQAEAAPVQPGSWRAALTGFTVILVAEFGDLTQIVIADLVARFHDPVAVGAGALAALWAVSAAFVLGGRSLLRFVPVRLVTRAAAVVLVALAAFSLAAAFG